MCGEETVPATEGAHLHWYGKHEVYPLRKMGHLTMTGDERDGLVADVCELRDGLTFRPSELH